MKWQGGAAAGEVVLVIGASVVIPQILPRASAPAGGNMSYYSAPKVSWVWGYNYANNGHGPC